MRKVIPIVSGGLDSITLAYCLRHQGYDLQLLSFDYGQRHKKELWYAREQSRHLNVPHDVVDLTSVTKMLKGSALTDKTVDVPEGHYAADNMAITIVPNRNMMMLSIAWAVAISAGAEAIATGIHAGDHAVYPDCREPFARNFVSAARNGTEAWNIQLFAPFVNITKAQIADLAVKLAVPITKTWSCYKGGDLHCGRCGTCLERMEAFIASGNNDPTTYEDWSLYWQLADEQKLARKKERDFESITSIPLIGVE